MQSDIKNPIEELQKVARQLQELEKDLQEAQADVEAAFWALDKLLGPRKEE